MTTRDAEIELSAGTLHYREFGADRPGAPIVFIHGVLANGLLWREVAARLAQHHRCIVPDWPLGAHATPMHADADLSVPAQASLVAELLDTLDLRDATLVGNDSGGAIAQLVAARFPARVARLVLTPCDAYEVFPPPLFSYLSWVPRIPGLSALLTKSMLILPILRRLPIAFGWLTNKPIPMPILDAWVRPAARSAGVRRDLGKFLRSVSPVHTLAAATELAAFKRPVLLLWAPENRFFSIDLARRFERELPNARIVEIEDAGVFVSEDQPERVASAIGDFLAAERATS